jgi:hypothetical protein
MQFPLSAGLVLHGCMIEQSAHQAVCDFTHAAGTNPNKAKMVTTVGDALDLLHALRSPDEVHDTLREAAESMLSVALEAAEEVTAKHSLFKNMTAKMALPVEDLTRFAIMDAVAHMLTSLVTVREKRGTRELFSAVMAEAWGHVDVLYSASEQQERWNEEDGKTSDVTLAGVHMPLVGVSADPNRPADDETYWSSKLAELLTVREGIVAKTVVVLTELCKRADQERETERRAHELISVMRAFKRVVKPLGGEPESIGDILKAALGEQPEQPKEPKEPEQPKE